MPGCHHDHCCLANLSLSLSCFQVINTVCSFCISFSSYLSPLHSHHHSFCLYICLLLHATHAMNCIHPMNTSAIGNLLIFKMPQDPNMATLLETAYHLIQEVSSAHLLKDIFLHYRMYPENHPDQLPKPWHLQNCSLSGI